MIRESLRQHFARIAYSGLFAFLTPMLAVRLRRRGRSEPLYGQAIGERFGRYVQAAVPGALWIHAVSLGETRAAMPMIAALRARDPRLRLLLTHGTATGRAAGRDLLRDGDAQAWLPFDTPTAVQRFLRHFQPRLGILMETEIWPNLLYATSAAGVPIVLVNARLSERSRRRGARVDALLRPAFARLALALAQSEADAQRLRAAGVGDARVVGNLKFDIEPDPSLLALGTHWRRSFAARPVVLFALSREGEEAILLAAWRALPTPRPLLTIVPRHPQRFDAVAALAQESNLALVRRSSWTEAPPLHGRAGASDGDDEGRVDIILGDSLLEMPAYYALADVALLGGSFAPLGGQNLIEAAACGCPLVLGPHTFNFAAAAEDAIAAGAALRVGDMASGIAAALRLVDGDAGRAELASRRAAALAFAGAHRGAAARTAEAIGQLLDEAAPPVA